MGGRPLPPESPLRVLPIFPRRKEIKPLGAVDLRTENMLVGSQRGWPVWEWLDGTLETLVGSLPYLRSLGPGQESNPAVDRRDERLGREYRRPPLVMHDRMTVGRVLVWTGGKSAGPKVYASGFVTPPLAVTHDPEARWVALNAGRDAIALVHAPTARVWLGFRDGRGPPLALETTMERGFVKFDVAKPLGVASLDPIKGRTDLLEDGAWSRLVVPLFPGILESTGAPDVAVKFVSLSLPSRRDSEDLVHCGFSEPKGRGRFQELLEAMGPDPRRMLQVFAPDSGDRSERRWEEPLETDPRAERIPPGPPEERVTCAVPAGPPPGHRCTRMCRPDHEDPDQRHAPDFSDGFQVQSWCAQQMRRYRRRFSAREKEWLGLDFQFDLDKARAAYEADLQAKRVAGVRRGREEADVPAPPPPQPATPEPAAPAAQEPAPPAASPTTPWSRPAPDLRKPPATVARNSSVFLKPFTVERYKALQRYDKAMMEGKLNEAMEILAWEIEDDKTEMDAETLGKFRERYMARRSLKF